ncbi:chromosome associated protein G [Cochliomyia hominivorax]
MGRKRKVPLVSEEKENEELCNTSNSNTVAIINNGPIYTIMSKVQLNETFHKKYIKELKQLYEKMDHDAFIFTFIKMIKTAMVAEETNEFAHTTLLFCAKFVSSFEVEETHPLLADICRWLLTTISNNPHIRFRLCQFVNMILNALGNEATLDDVICDSIMEYMVGRLVDISPSVRVQAILAMQRLQVPDNPDDPVLRSYQYHLCSDPSPRVRQAVITSMGRNYHTIPYILDRLWDIDEKVRRHTYLHMSSYPVRSYKVSQRLTLLEQGLNDRSESVRKVVTNVMLQQWIESYQKDLVSLIGALKLDSNESEINRFRKIGKQVLREIFKRQNKGDMISCLCIEEEGDYYRCVPFDKLNLEMSFYWQCVTEYLQNEMAEELDQVVPELSKFCDYIESYCKSRKTEMDKFEAMEFQYILLSLMEILYTFDLGDEIGRGNLQKLLHHLLKSCTLDEKVIEVIVKCSENLITEQDTRHQFFLDIIHDICGLNAKQQDLVHDRNLISELLADSTDADLSLKLSSLKVKILDLEEQEMNFVQKKDYVRAQQIIEEKNIATEEFTNLLRPLLEKRNNNSGDAAQPQFSKVVKYDCILRSLQITYYMVASKRVKTLGHTTCRLYNDFIFRNIASNQIAIRDWALKCGAAFSMLYEPLAKDVFDELYAQFFKNHNIRIWETAITCIFELLDRYGVDSFAVQEEQNKSKKTGRQLYNTLEFIDADDDTRQSTTLGQGVGVIYMMSHFLDTCDDMCIVRAIINGFCRLVLHGHIENRDIMEKLLLRYFNPSTEPEINQILGVFLENLIQNRKQNLLQPCLMITVNSVLCAPYDSPLHDIRPETITRFIIDATRPEAVSVNNGENSHNKLALVFLNEMLNNSNNKELCKLLAKELITLEVNVLHLQELKKEMKELVDKLIQNKFDPKTVKCIIDFKDMLDGVFNPPAKGANDDLDTEDEDDEPETNSSENNVETEIVNIVDDVNIEAITNSSTPHDKEKSEETLNLQNGTNNVTVVANQNVDVSPSAANMPTTFGSENVTRHRYLRKSLNLSRNNSVDSNGNSNNDNETKPSKIRIEARIDSDKKQKSTPKISQSDNSKSKRSLRYSKRNRNHNDGNENNEAELTQAKPREPEIIEKILNSPTKINSLSKSQTEFRLEGEINIKENQTENNTDSVAVEEAVTDDQNLRRENRNNESECDKSDDELDVSEVIPESPTDKSINTVLGTTTRLRANSTMRSMRSRTFRNVSQSNGKKMDTTSSHMTTVASTPLRNGRKRVLRTSPKLIASTAMSSPVRKQPCIEIDRSDTSRITFTPRSTRKRVLEKTTHIPTDAEDSPALLNRNYPVEKNANKDVSNSSTSVISPSSNKENEVQKKKTISNGNKLNSRLFLSDTKKTPSRDLQKQNKSILTRNSAKKELLSKMIITRKRLSQESPTIQSSYSKLTSKTIFAKSRIPVRSQTNVYKTVEDKIEKTEFSKTKRALSGKIPVGRLKIGTSLASSYTSTRSVSSSSGKYSRRRNV